MIDDLDQKIVRYLCEGVHSYSELGKICNVGRNTIYRRVDKLERMGIITKRTAALPNFDKLNLSAVLIGMDLNLEDMAKAVSFLRKQHRVKLLWTTYGAHDLIFIVLCNKEDVGTCILNLKKSLKKVNITPTKFDVSVSISWEKIYLCP